MNQKLNAKCFVTIKKKTQNLFETHSKNNAFVPKKNLFIIFLKTYFSYIPHLSKAAFALDPMNFCTNKYLYHVCFENEFDN